MKLIELHILQSFPVTCLNRDDVGAPKTAVFGGVTRARISSQCQKKAIRDLAKEEYPAARFGGIRTRRIIELLQEALIAQKLSEEDAKRLASQIADMLARLDEETIDSKTDTPEEERRPRVKTLFFLSPTEINALAKSAASLVREKKEIKIDEKRLFKDAFKDVNVPLNDAADIAIFGRMATSEPGLKLEGAAMFSHALSTHKADNDIDFFSAVDDVKLKEEDAGAAHINVLEFTSAVYYRYTALNLGMLADNDHLGSITPEERRQVVDAFIRATLLAVPGARKNSMNGNTLPGYVLGIYKDRGQPVQLINAFETPVVWSKKGLLEESKEVLIHHYKDLKRIWNVETREEVAIPDDGDLNAFCEKLTRYVE